MRKHWLVLLFIILSLLIWKTAPLVARPAPRFEAVGEKPAPQTQRAVTSQEKNISSTSAITFTITYSVTNLGRLPGHEDGFSSASDINEKGQVVGSSSAADRIGHAFIWENGKMQDLGNLGGFPTFSLGINEAGQVTGASDTSGGEQHAFLWQNGKMQDLGTVTGYPNVGHDINDVGQIVGVVDRAAGSLVVTGFLWKDGAAELISAGADEPVVAFGLNNLGQAVGALQFKDINSKGHKQPALWDGGSWNPLGSLAGDLPPFFDQGYAYGVNDLTEVVGVSDTLSGELHAFLWRESSGMIDLGTLGGNSSLANDINVLSQVVGFSDTATGTQHAFLWQDSSGDGQAQPGEMIDLNELIPDDSGWEIQMAHGINNSGQIAATGKLDGKQYAVMLTPISLCDPTSSGGDSEADNDVGVNDLEITQGIQNIGNEMPLVEYRQTMARVHIYLDGKNSTAGWGVGGQLRAFHNGKELSGSPIAPMSATGLALGDGGDRNNLGHTLNFRLPPLWLTGDVTFCAEVNHTQAFPETDFENNVIETMVTFQTGTPLDIRFVPVHLHEDNDSSEAEKVYTLSEPDAGKIIANLFRYHPVVGVRYKQTPTLFPTWHTLLGNDWDMSTEVGGIRLLNAIAEYDLLTEDNVAGTHYAGMIHPDVDVEGLGRGKRPGTASWTVMGNESGGNPSWYIQGGSSLSHELGHNKGFKHVNCNDSEAGPDPNYPWPHPNCQLADTDPLGYYGLDVNHQSIGLADPVVISNDPKAAAPNQGFPLMGYQRPRWISPYEYCNLLPIYGVPCDLSWSAPLAVQRQPPSPKQVALNPLAYADRQELSLLDTSPAHIVAMGIISPTSDIVELDSVYTLDEIFPDALEQAGMALGYKAAIITEDPYQLVQMDDADAVLHTQEILLNTEDSEWQGFLETAALMTDTVKIQVQRSGVVMAERSASPNPPEVTLLSPNGGGTLRVGDTISWSASDDDADELFFNLLYSPDDGLTWRALIIGLTGSSYQLPSLDGISGSQQARLRVMANDGWHTVYDDSDSSFTIPDSNPSTLLLAPFDKAIFRPGEALILHGIATDDEDGPLPGSSLSWSSDLDGPLGSGEQVWVDKLRTGWHTITLTAMDSDGHKSSSRARILVGYYALLPTIVSP